MKKSLLVIAATVFWGASAFAADMPMKAPVYKAAAPGYNWTGWYVGINAGGGLSQSAVEASKSVFGGGVDINGGGFSGGAQIGYNWQFAPQWVVGVEADIGHLGIKRSFGDFNDEDKILGVQTGTFGTVRGRLGYAAGPSLLYVTAGAAFVHVTNSFEDTDDGIVSTSKTATGWTAGGGIETMLAPGWSAKLEYLYVDVGGASLVGPPVDLPHFDFDNRFHVVRAGLNYRFGGPGIIPAGGVAASIPAAAITSSYNWTGVYAGLNAGTGIAHSNAVATNTARFEGSVDVNDAGFTGGAQAGYNWQFNPNWVVGLEGDISYLGINHSFVDLNEDPDEFGVKTNAYGTIRGRMGYVIGPSLFYATAGAAFVHIQNRDSIFGTLTNSKTASGWTAGGGLETKLNANWSAKAEYLYIDAGHLVVPFSPISVVIFDNRFHVFRFGVNYQFSAASMAPVAARY